MITKPRITILYCTQCSWLLRSAWMAQELLSTFGADLGEVALIPGTGGVFEIRVEGDLIWERKRDGGFPEAKVLKQKVRDIVWPERDLGHSDGHKAEGASFDKLRMRESEAAASGAADTTLPHGEPVEPRANGGASSSKRGQ
jgi:selenoprotein W-related protein